MGPNLKKSQIYFRFSKMEFKFWFFSKVVTASWKIPKKTEENIWSKILLYAKRKKLHCVIYSVAKFGIEGVGINTIILFFSDKN